MWGYILDGIKNFWGEDVNATIYQVTYLKFFLKKENHKEMQLRLLYMLLITKKLEKKEVMRNCFGEKYILHATKHQVTWEKKSNEKLLRSNTYKGLRFLRVMQQFIGDWISNQLTKLVRWFSRNLQIFSIIRSRHDEECKDPLDKKVGKHLKILVIFMRSWKNKMSDLVRCYNTFSVFSWNRILWVMGNKNSIKKEEKTENVSQNHSFLYQTSHKP